MKENDRGKLAVAPPKRKDDSPSISRETARSFFVPLCEKKIQREISLRVISRRLVDPGSHWKLIHSP
ncbi:MAG: hypothetical protein [Olavius algarvensis Gamma 1 endosymbiont]|nr:MAG: hypothetical protein [Olavius algarvensis Gamma 1 endosymbiont]